jgi:hypothetical protein
MIERKGTPLVRLVPSEFAFRFLSRLSKKEALKRLEENIAQTNPLTAHMSDKYFVGSVYHSDFQIRELVGYSRVLLPVFYGNLKEEPEGLVVRVKASNLLASLETLVFYGLFVGCLWAAASEILSQKPDLSGLLLLLFAFAWGSFAFFTTWLYERRSKTEKYG